MHATTVEYAPGHRCDLYGAERDPSVLIWHGRRTDHRAAMAPLARSLGAGGFRSIVAGWSSFAEDRGRAGLLGSVRFARETAAHDPDDLRIVGWSLGGLAAASLAVHQRRLGIELSHVVLLAPAWADVDPISHQPLPEPRTPKVGTRLLLVHGVDDDEVPVAGSREALDTWSAAGWPIELTELDTDHAGVLGGPHVDDLAAFLR